MKSLSPSQKAGIIVFSLALCLVLTLVLGIWGPNPRNVVSLPGNLLFQSFSWAAFYLPIYLMGCGTLLMVKVFRRDILFTLNMTLLPFLTLSVLFNLLSRPADTGVLGFFIHAFGQKGGAIIILLILPLEAVLIARIKYQFFPAPGRDKRTRREPEGDPRENIVKTPKLLPVYGTGNAGADTIPADEWEELIEEVPEDEVLEEGLPVGEGLPIAEFEDEDEPGGYTRLLTEEALKLNRDYDTLDYTPLSGADGKRQGRATGRTGPAKANVPYAIPAEGILNDYPDGRYWEIDDTTMKAAEVLKRTLEEFRIQAEVTGIRKGPVVTMFEILPAPGVKLSKIENLADNIALRLAASSVRIIAPIPGKHAVGIEVPNKKRSIVSFKEMISTDTFQQGAMNIPVVLGKDITGEAQIVDLTQTPHLLIAGATGSGKSVCVNSIICSILYGKSPREVRLLLIDPKIVELKLYNGIPHLLTPVVTDPKRAFQALQYCIFEMERRYALLDNLGARDIASYNRKAKDPKAREARVKAAQRELDFGGIENRSKLLAADVETLPYLVIIIDEFADLMATTGKELETTLARLAAMARAVGIHLVLATQRPSTNVITGLIKANIPSRIAFLVANNFDSRIILDSVGAEKLLGKGDMLFTSAWDPFPARIQGAYLSEEEVGRVAAFAKTLGQPDYLDDEIFVEDDSEDTGFDSGADDPLLDKALEIIVEAGKASASYLQRRLKIGYNRAARIVENLEERGILGPANGSKPREIIHIPQKPRD